MASGGDGCRVASGRVQYVDRKIVATFAAEVGERDVWPASLKCQWHMNGPLKCE